MIIFTSICANYAHKARALARSVHAHLPDATFYLCLTEREIPEALQKDTCFDHIVLSREMWKGDFDAFIFKHDIVEASTAVKGAFLQYLQATHPEEDAFIYLDPDCFVYSDFPELRAALKEKPGVLCPHLLHPGNVDMEMSSTAHGVYNLGFLAVNGSEEAHRLVDWWAERLQEYCYDDMMRGIFTDQRWMDLAPCFFDIRVMKHYGYDFAPWGLKGTSVAQGADGQWLIQGMPLRFIHFSGFGSVAQECMNRWMDEDNQAFRRLYDDYAKEHAACDADQVSKTPWSYAAYASGEKIDREVRIAWRECWRVMQDTGDPFQRSNVYLRKLLNLPIPREELEPEITASTALGRKWQTAQWVLKRYGWAGVFDVIWDRLRGKG